ncbi:hypothetical protein [Posidoniimonas corsicana]|nr:hypothetical protein [Posidoniimonas corsicana]
MAAEGGRPPSEATGCLAKGILLVSWVAFLVSLAMPVYGSHGPALESRWNLPMFWCVVIAWPLWVNNLIVLISPLIAAGTSSPTNKSAAPNFVTGVLFLGVIGGAVFPILTGGYESYGAGYYTWLASHAGVASAFFVFADRQSIAATQESITREPSSSTN